MELPTNVEEFPDFIRTQLPEDKFPEWNERMVQACLSMRAGGYSQGQVVCHMMSMVAGAVWVLQDIEGAE